MSQSISAARVHTLVGDFDRSPAYRGLADALRELIGDGRIGFRVRLPSERELTADLQVSRTTVTRAYAELCESGYAVARHGAGTFTDLPGGPVRAYDRALHPGSAPAGLDLVCAAASAPPGIAAAYAEAVADLPAYLGGHGYFPAGAPVLQAAIAASYDARGLPTRPEQIIVTSGALAATAVVSCGLAGRGTRAIVDSPTYPNAAQSLRNNGVRVVPVPVEPDGWDIDGLRSTIGKLRPTLAHLMPEFHNPTGLVMTTQDRERYAHALQQAGTTPIVDEAHQALTLDDAEPPPNFATFAPESIMIGSASKSVWGGLRIGWLRSPAALVDRLTQARVTLDLGAPILEQLVLARLLADPQQSVLREHRARLREQRDAMAAAVRDRLPDWKFRLPTGGMVLWCELPHAASTALVEEAERHELHLAPGPAFAPAGGLDRFLRLPYALPVPDLTEAVRRLALAWDAVIERPARRRTSTAISDRVMVA